MKTEINYFTKAIEKLQNEGTITNVNDRYENYEITGELEGNPVIVRLTTEGGIEHALKLNPQGIRIRIIVAGAVVLYTPIEIDQYPDVINVMRDLRDKFETEQRDKGRIYYDVLFK